MRGIVFEDETARHDLEAILHPRIGTETRRQADAARGPYQIIVVPLLVGSPLLKFVDRVLVVDCDEETQIQRLLARDDESVEQAKRILAAQASRQARLSIADDLVSNDGDLSETHGRVIELDQLYRRLSDLRCPSEQSR
jgi:dephospho-CoA kinase